MRFSLRLRLGFRAGPMMIDEHRARRIGPSGARADGLAPHLKGQNPEGIDNPCAAFSRQTPEGSPT
jgi:hypothetical protein